MGDDGPAWTYAEGFPWVNQEALCWHRQSSVIIVLYLIRTQHRYHDNWKWTVHSLQGAELGPGSVKTPQGTNTITSNLKKLPNHKLLYKLMAGQLDYLNRSQKLKMCKTCRVHASGNNREETQHQWFSLISWSPCPSLFVEKKKAKQALLDKCSVITLFWSIIQWIHSPNQEDRAWGRTFIFILIHTCIINCMILFSI